MIARKLAFLFVLLLPWLGWAGDTGTYRIDDYRVHLTPHADGKVTIEYQQKWAVTGGHIPWITVGVPNRSFTIRESRGAVKSLANASEGGWAGVRVDLNRDYRPGESFEIGFSLEQAGLFHAAGNNLALDFTPGWYDRAAIGQLTVTMKLAAPTGEVKAAPAPTTVEGQEITWVRQNLAPGTQVRFSAAFPKTRMPHVVTAANRHAPANRIPPEFVFILIFIIVIVLIIWTSSRGGWNRGGGGYSHGGTIYYGGSRGSGGHSRKSSGGGGFGGSASSCACACVSCACACACAGGGGAGCAKKTSHSCALCRNRKGHGR